MYLHQEKKEKNFAYLNETYITVYNLVIPKYENGDKPHLKTNIALTVKTILKYRNHLNAIFITRFWNQASSLNLSFIDKNTVLKAIACLSTTKASQDFDLLVKILKENADYFVEIICT